MLIENGVLVKVKNSDANSDGTFTFPAEVHTIGFQAFSWCSDIKNLVIPKTIKTIEDAAFENCIGLRTVNILAKITILPLAAFAYCTTLKEITLPSTITIIDDEVFCNCKQLETINIPPYVKEIGEAAFEKCTLLKSVTLHNRLTEIKDLAFSDCYSLKTVALPDSLTHIGDFAFDSCINLEYVRFHKNIKHIGVHAFNGCGKLKSAKGIYKGFDNDLTCRDYQFEMGRWAEYKKKISLCKNGYHYCTNLFEIFNYYSGEFNEDIIFCTCETGKKVKKSRTKLSSKCVTNTIKPVKQLTGEEIIKILNGEAVL